MPDTGSAESMEEDILVPSMFANATTLPHVCTILIAQLPSRLINHCLRLSQTYGKSLPLSTNPFRSDPHSSRGFVMRRSGEVVWPSEPSSRTHCLSFSSTHRYDPKAHKSKGGWEPAGDLRAQEENTKEVFHLTAQKWFYAGTYEYQNQTILPLSEISVLSKNVRVSHSACL